MDLKYAYLTLAGLFAVAWVGVYLARPALRRRMLVVSACTTPCGPVAELFHLRDYWHPLYVWNTPMAQIEDLVAAFVTGGLGAVMFDAVFPAPFTRAHRPSTGTLGLMIVGGWLAVALMTSRLGMNSVPAMSAVSFTIGLYMVARRRDLLFGAIGNGLLFAALLWCAYWALTVPFPRMFSMLWMTQNLSGVHLGPVPVEELLWGFTWGFVAWPLYPFFAGIRRVDRTWLDAR